MNKQIERFNYKNLDNEKHVQYHETARQIMVKYNVEELGIKKAFDVYEPLLNTEVSLLDQLRKSGLTPEMEAMDKRRDELFNGFSSIVKACLVHYDADKRAAAEKVALIVKNYGAVASKPLDKETAAIEDLHRELMAPLTHTCVDQLGLAQWLAHMVDANRMFNDLMMQRYSETAQRPTETMKTARKKVDDAFRDVLNLIDALQLVNSTDANAALIAELNAVSKRYADIMAQQKGTRDARKKENGETPTT